MVPSTSWRLQQGSVPKATVANSSSPVSVLIGSEALTTVRAKAEMGLVGEVVQNTWPLGGCSRLVLQVGRGAGWRGEDLTSRDSVLPEEKMMHLRREFDGIPVER